MNLDSMRMMLESAIGNSAHYYYVFILMSCSFGFPFSSDLMMFLGGSLAALGHLDIQTVVLSSPLAILTGDSLTFFIGRRYGKTLLESRWIRKIFSVQKQAETQRFLLDHSKKFIFGTRFVPGLRSFIFLMAGSIRLRRRDFYLMNILSTCIYAPSLILMSYLASKQMKSILDGFQKYKWLVFLLIGVIFVVTLKRLRRQGAS